MLSKNGMLATAVGSGVAGIGCFFVAAYGALWGGLIWLIWEGIQWLQRS